MIRRKRSSRALCEYKRYELLFGECVYPLPEYYTGYGDPRSGNTNVADFISDEMKADWAANRSKLIAFWKSGEYTRDKPWLFARGDPDTLPWAATKFDDKEEGSTAPSRQYGPKR